MSWPTVKVLKNSINEDWIMMNVILLGSWVGVVVVSLIVSQIVLKKFDLL